MSDRIAIPGRIQVRLVWAAVRRNHSERAGIFVQHDHLIEPLHNLPLIGRKHGLGNSRRVAICGRAGIVGPAHDSKLLRTGLQHRRRFERTRRVRNVHGSASREETAREDHVVNSGEVWPPVRHFGDLPLHWGHCFPRGGARNRNRNFLREHLVTGAMDRQDIRRGLPRGHLSASPSHDSSNFGLDRDADRVFDHPLKPYWLSCFRG